MSADLSNQDDVTHAAVRVQVGPARVDVITLDTALGWSLGAVAAKKLQYVVTPNVDHLVKLDQDQALRAAYEAADLVLADGKPVVWLSYLLGASLPERISGVDYFWRLCKILEVENLTLYLVGGTESSSHGALLRLSEAFPSLRVVGRFTGPLEPGENMTTAPLISDLASCAPDVVAIFLGCPKQEILVHSLRRQLPPSLYLCLGGTVDFVSGKTKRAPLWMRRWGLEWAHRLFKEPRRLWRRYLIEDLSFLRIAAHAIVVARRQKPHRC